jgi:hypothetical protein
MHHLFEVLKVCLSGPIIFLNLNPAKLRSNAEVIILCGLGGGPLSGLEQDFLSHITLWRIGLFVELQSI